MTLAASSKAETSLGKYRLERRLGEGGMGIVWAGIDDKSGRKVALKTLKPHARSRPDLKRRLMREARTAGAVHHPNVVTVHEVFDAGDEGPVIVMDLLEGETLRAKLAREERLSVSEAASIMLPVASAVAAAHAQGIVHRDLKPDNIFLRRDVIGPERVQVLDFGIAKLVEVAVDPADSAGATSTGTLLGTPWYMAPEQGFGERDIDCRADVWALGVILYECLSGGRPVEGENLGQVLKRLVSQGITPLSDVAPHVPADLAELVDRMLATEREGRLSDVRAVAGLLGRHAGVEHSDCSAPSPGAARRARRASVARVAVTSILVVVFGLIGARLAAEHSQSSSPLPVAAVAPRGHPARASDGSMTTTANTHAVAADVPRSSPAPRVAGPERASSPRPLPPPLHRKRAPAPVAVPAVLTSPSPPTAALPAPPSSLPSPRAASSVVPATTILGGLAATPPF